MTVVITVFIVSLVILLLALYISYASYEDYLDIAEENQRLSRLLEECFWMQNDSLEAYREMLSTACQEDGFWETEDDVVEVDE